MNLFPDVAPVIVFGNYLVVYTCEPGLPSSSFLKTNLKLKVYRPLLSKCLPTEKQQMLSCP
jgi:hypothetical protein